MGYCTNDSIVEGNLFKKGSGKWAYNVAIDMHSYYDAHWSTSDAVKVAIRATPCDVRGVSQSAVEPGCGYYLVVLAPAHQYGHPVMVDLDC